MELISLVITVWGIFEIILFFKIWGMTKNVANIEENIKNMGILPQKHAKDNNKEDDELNKFKFLYYLEDYDEAFKVLNKYLFSQISRVDDYYIFDNDGEMSINGDNGIISVEKFIKEKLDSVRPLYEKIGREIPKQLANFNIDEFEDFGKTKKDDEDAQ